MGTPAHRDQSASYTAMREVLFALNKRGMDVKSYGLRADTDKANTHAPFCAPKIETDGGIFCTSNTSAKLKLKTDTTCVDVSVDKEIKVGMLGNTEPKPLPPLIQEDSEELEEYCKQELKPVLQRQGKLDRVVNSLGVMKISQLREAQQKLRSIEEEKRKAKDRYRKEAIDRKHKNLEFVKEKQAFTGVSLKTALDSFKSMIVDGTFDLPVAMMNVYYSVNNAQLLINLGSVCLKLAECSPTHILQLFNADILADIRALEALGISPNVHKQAFTSSGSSKEKEPELASEVNTSFFYTHFGLTSKKQAVAMLGIMIGLAIFKDANVRTLLKEMKVFLTGREVSSYSMVENVLDFLAKKATFWFDPQAPDVENRALALIRKDATYTLVTSDGTAYKWQYYPAYSVELNKMLAEVRRFSSLNESNTYITARMKTVENLVISSLEECYRQCVKRRVEPCIIGIYGPAGMGKTCITKLMSDLMTHALGLGCIDEYSSFISEVSDPKFVTAKRGIILNWDDLGMVEGGVVYGQIMMFANNIPGTFASAAVDEKGKHSIDGIAGIVTSNHRDFGVSNSGILYESAFMRRFDFVVMMEVKPEFCVVAANGTVSTALDSAKLLAATTYVEGRPVTPDAWNFIIKKVITIGASWEYETQFLFTTLRDYLKWFIEAFKANRIRKSRAFNNQQATVFCKKCDLPLACHSDAKRCEFEMCEADVQPTPEKPEVALSESTLVPCDDVKFDDSYSGYLKDMFEKTKGYLRPKIVPVQEKQAFVFEKPDVMGALVWPVTKVCGSFLGSLFGYKIYSSVFTLFKKVEWVCDELVPPVPKSKQIYEAMPSVPSSVKSRLADLMEQVRIRLAPYYGSEWFFAILDRVRGYKEAFIIHFCNVWDTLTPAMRAVNAFLACVGIYTLLKQLINNLFPKEELVRLTQHEMWKRNVGLVRHYPGFRNYNNETKRFLDFARESVYTVKIFETREDLLAWRQDESVEFAIMTGFFVRGKIFATCSHFQIAGKWLHFTPRDGANDVVSDDIYIPSELVSSDDSDRVEAGSDWQFVYIPGTVNRPDLLKMNSQKVSLLDAEQDDILFTATNIGPVDQPYVIETRKANTRFESQGFLNYTVPGFTTRKGNSGSLFLRAQGTNYSFFHHEGVGADSIGCAAKLPISRMTEFEDSLRLLNYPIDVTLKPDLTKLSKALVVVPAPADNPLSNYTGHSGLSIGQSASIIPTGTPKEVMYKSVLNVRLEHHLSKAYGSPSGAKWPVQDPETGVWHRCSPYDIRLAMVGDINAPIDTKIVNRAVSSYIERLDTMISKVPPPGPYTEDQILNGDTERKLRPINRDTSSGFGWRGTKVNHLIQVDGRWRMGDELRESFDRYVASMEQGYVEGVITKVSIKMNEAIPLAKVETGRSRQVYTMQLEYLLVAKMYLGPILELMGLNQFAFECMVGVNAMSSDWQAIYDYLSGPGFTQSSPMDFSGYDIKIVGVLMEGTCQVFMHCGLHYLKYTSKQMLVLAAVLICQSQPIFVYRNVLKFLTSGEVSGHPATAQVNSVTNSIYQRCSWFDTLVNKLKPLFYFSNTDFTTSQLCDVQISKAEHTIVRYPEEVEDFESLNDYDAHNRLVTYGDDVLNSRSAYAVQMFRGEWIKDSFLRFGQTVTDANDKSKPPKFGPIEDLQFLKRTFREITWYDYTFMSAPLEEEVIYKMMCFNCVSKNCTPSEILTQVCENAYREMWLHGPERFYSFCDEMEPIFEMYKIKPRVGRGSAHQWALDMEKKNFTTWQEEQWNFHLTD